MKSLTSSKPDRTKRIVALLAASSGCTTDAYTGEKEVSKTAIGAVIGAAAGAGIGALANKRNRGAQRVADGRLVGVQRAAHSSVACA